MPNLKICKFAYYLTSDFDKTYMLHPGSHIGAKYRNITLNHYKISYNKRMYHTCTYTVQSFRISVQTGTKCLLISAILLFRSFIDKIPSDTTLNSSKGFSINHSSVQDVNIDCCEGDHCNGNTLKSEGVSVLPVLPAYLLLLNALSRALTS